MIIFDLITLFLLQIAICFVFLKQNRIIKDVLELLREENKLVKEVIEFNKDLISRDETKN